MRTALLIFLMTFHISLSYGQFAIGNRNDTKSKSEIQKLKPEEIAFRDLFEGVLYYHSGQPAKALPIYERCDSLLSQKQSFEPSHEMALGICQVQLAHCMEQEHYPLDSVKAKLFMGRSHLMASGKSPVYIMRYLVNEAVKFSNNYRSVDLGPVMFMKLKLCSEDSLTQWTYYLDELYRYAACAGLDMILLPVLQRCKIKLQEENATPDLIALMAKDIGCVKFNLGLMDEADIDFSYGAMALLMPVTDSKPSEGQMMDAMMTDIEIRIEMNKIQRLRHSGYSKKSMEELGETLNKLETKFPQTKLVTTNDDNASRYQRLLRIRGRWVEELAEQEVDINSAIKITEYWQHQLGNKSPDIAQRLNLTLGNLYARKWNVTKALDYYQKGLKHINIYPSKEEWDRLAYLFYLNGDSVSSAYLSAFLVSKLRGKLPLIISSVSPDGYYSVWEAASDKLTFYNNLFYHNARSQYADLVYNNILSLKGLLMSVTSYLSRFRQKLGQDVQQEMKDRDLLLDSLAATGLPTYRMKEDKAMMQMDVAYASKLDEEITKRMAVKWPQIRNRLRPGEMSIEFFRLPILSMPGSVGTTSSNYFAIVGKQAYEKPHIVKLMLSSDNEDKLADAYDTSLVYRYVWKPLEEEINDVKTIYFAADGVLHKIPIEYARCPDGQCINDNRRLFRLTSTVEILTKHQPIPHEATLYGGLRYEQGQSNHDNNALVERGMRYGVDFLPWSSKEVENIEHALQKHHFAVSTFIDSLGSERSFRKSSGKMKGILHLSTHGFFWDKATAERRSYVGFLHSLSRLLSNEDLTMARSGLFFSGANTTLRGQRSLPQDNDGVLTALEISKLRMDSVRLVVLSACDTGLGDISGEGVYGLQRAFKVAGVQSLLMTLWPVDDAATCLLMTYFYKSLLQGTSMVDALHEAQQRLRKHKRYDDPKFWAGFILLDANE